MADVFLDTNILLYAATATPVEAPKRRIARELMRVETFGISTQVLQEFFHVATRKAHIRMPAKLASEWLSGLDDRPCAVIDRDLVKVAMAISGRFKIGYWDAAIIAAAEALGAKTIFSEDLNHGQKYGPVQVLNPFRGQ
jgi:predicted nucleic acid-binding protein